MELNQNSFLQHGLKKPNERAGDKVIGLRSKYEEDRIGRIELDLEVNGIKNWAEAVFTSYSVYYVTTRAYAEHFMDHKGEEWVIVLECRLKQGTYKQYDHTLEEYYFNTGEESKLLENRSDNSQNVKVSALWYFTKKFIKDFRNHKILLKKLKKFINQ